MEYANVLEHKDIASGFHELNKVPIYLTNKGRENELHQINIF